MTCGLSDGLELSRLSNMVPVFPQRHVIFFDTLYSFHIEKSNKEAFDIVFESKVRSWRDGSTVQDTCLQSPMSQVQVPSTNIKSDAQGSTHSGRRLWHTYPHSCSVCLFLCLSDKNFFKESKVKGCILLLLFVRKYLGSLLRKFVPIQDYK